MKLLLSTILLLAIALPLGIQAEEASSSEEVQEQADDAILLQKEKPKPASVKDLIKAYQTLEGLGYENIRLATQGSRFEKSIQDGTEISPEDESGVLVITVGEDDEIYINDKRVSRQGLGVEIDAIRAEHGKVSVLLDGSQTAKSGVMNALGLVDSFEVKDVAVLKLTKEF